MTIPLMTVVELTEKELEHLIQQAHIHGRFGLLTTATNGETISIVLNHHNRRDRRKAALRDGGGEEAK